jgi:hypothetical protein
VQKNIVLLLSTTIALLFTQFAFAMPPQPAVCPSVTTIGGVGVSRTTVQINRLWFAGRRSNTYATGNKWTFVMGNIPASTANDAYLKATANLPSLFIEAGPFYESEIDRWVCIYGTATGMPAVAMNPPLVTFNSSAKLSKYLS